MDTLYFPDHLLELELLQYEQFQKEIRKGVGLGREWKVREETRARKRKKEEDLTNATASSWEMMTMGIVDRALEKSSQVLQVVGKI